MELFQVLHKNIPPKKKVFLCLQKGGTKDFSKFLLQIIKKMKNGHNDSGVLNLFCIELYDALYQDIVFGKIKIVKKFLRLFEELALPMNYVGKQKRNETLKKIVKTKL